MDDDDGETGRLGVILGVLVAIVAVAFLLNGGENVGKKTVKSDSRPAAGHISDSDNDNPAAFAVRRVAQTDAAAARRVVRRGSPQ